MGSGVPDGGFAAPRFEGERWVVLMDEELWRRFSTEVPASANERLTVKLRHLAQHGEADMPRPRLRIEPDPRHPGVTIASVEARGVVLRGQVTEIGGRMHLFTRSIVIDPIEDRPPAAGRGRKPTDDRQGRLGL